MLEYNNESKHLLNANYVPLNITLTRYKDPMTLS